MPITKGSVISILCGSLLGVFIGCRPIANNTLDMFVQEMELEGGGVTYKHGNFRAATLDKACHAVRTTGNCSHVTNDTCVQMNCTSNIHIDFPPVAKFIEWNNIFPSLLYLGVCVFFFLREIKVEGVLLLWFFIEGLMFTNYVLYAALVGSSMGFTASNLTVPYYILVIISGLFMMLPIIVLLWSIIVTERTKASMVRVRYNELIKKDHELGLSCSLTSTDTSASNPGMSVIEDQISCMLLSLWTKEKNNVGIGNDATGLKHTDIHVEKVIHVNNCYLIERYNKTRNRVAAFALSVGGRLKGLNEYSGVRKTCDTVSSALSLGIDGVEHSINEYFLFHGTKLSNAKCIAEEGFNVEKSRRTMLGRGMYFSDSFVKADQYTMPDENGMCCVIMAKVLLGDFIVTLNRNSIPSTAQQPPCKKCLKTDCKGKHKKGRPRFDSVVYTGGLFREYIIFDNWQAYPEYIISYKRV